jgi:hypothetical protein
LGSFSKAGKLTWKLATNSVGFGDTASDPTWIGDFSGSGRAQVLFYSPGDQNWFLGSFSKAGKLTWKLATNSKGFGNTFGDPTWIGNFTGAAPAQLLFYSPGDQNWFLGSFSKAGKLTWKLATNSAGFGDTASDPTWIGDFSGSGRAQVLFYSPGDQNWFLGSFSKAGKLTWKLATNSAGFGDTAFDPTWIV